MDAEEASGARSRVGVCCIAVFLIGVFLIAGLSLKVFAAEVETTGRMVKRNLSLIRSWCCETVANI